MNNNYQLSIFSYKLPDLVCFWYFLASNFNTKYNFLILDND